MVSLRSLSWTSAAITVLFFVLLVGSEGYRGRVGGRMEIRDVRKNEEVQELGKFSVEEYNRKLRLRPHQNDGRAVEFGEVVSAEKQVVSGIKYYLKISATEQGVTRMFDSVVVVKPWVRSEQLLNFGPSCEGQDLRVNWY